MDLGYGVFYVINFRDVLFLFLEEQKNIVEATLLVDPLIPKSSKALPKYGKIFLDKKGKIKSISKVDFAFEKNKLYAALNRLKTRL